MGQFYLGSLGIVIASSAFILLAIYYLFDDESERISHVIEIGLLIMPQSAFVSGLVETFKASVLDDLNTFMDKLAQKVSQSTLPSRHLSTIFIHLVYSVNAAWTSQL
jgi:hypothetical protein